jgi:hypothetical protein
MAATLKSRGLMELSSLRRRVERQRALGRITGPDKVYLLYRIDEIEARIIEMHETNAEGEEE